MAFEPLAYSSSAFMADKAGSWETFEDCIDVSCIRDFAVRASKDPAQNAQPPQKVNIPDLFEAENYAHVVQFTDGLPRNSVYDGGSGPVGSYEQSKLILAAAAARGLARGNDKAYGLPGHFNGGAAPGYAAMKTVNTLAPYPASQPTNGHFAGGGAGQNDMQHDNPGSFGHPFLCNRRCIFYISGRCANGSACAFCHCPHLARPAKMDKKQREAFQVMPTAKAMTLVSSVLVPQVLALDSSLATRRSLDCFSAFAYRYPAALAANHMDRQVMKVLGAMNVRQLIILLQRLVLHDSPEGLAVTEEMAQHLRSVAGMQHGWAMDVV